MSSNTQETADTASRRVPETAITEHRPGRLLLGDDDGRPEHGGTIVPQFASAATNSERTVFDAFTVNEVQPRRIPSSATTTIVTHAVMVDSDNEVRRSDRCRMASLGILSLVFLMVILVVTLFLTRRGGGGNDTSRSVGDEGTRTVSPSSIGFSLPPTTKRFSDIRQEILTHFDSLTLEQNLDDPTSPQYRAAIWMAEEDKHPTTASLSYPLNPTDLKLLQFRQRYALATFYYSTGGEDWKDQCNFLMPSLHVCDWRCLWNSTDTIMTDNFGLEFGSTDFMGVNCGRHRLHRTNLILDDLVVYLEIGNNNLVGTFPDEIQGLDVVQRLLITSNWLRGTVPFDALANTMIVKRPLFAENLGFFRPQADEHSNASEGVGSSSGAPHNPALERLSVYQNLLTGTIPSALGLLGAIEHLEFNTNQFSGRLPSSLGHLTALTALVASINKFTGELPSSLGLLTALTALGVSDNLFSGRLPSSLGQLTALTALDLPVNKFTGELPSSLGNLTALQYLSFSDNLFSGGLPSSLRHLTALTVLDAHSNNFTGELPASLGNLKALQALVLSDNKFSGSLLSTLGRLTALVFLSFRTNNLTGELPSSLGNLTVLQELFFYDNMFSGRVPSTLGQLTALTKLDFSTNRFTGEIPSRLGQLTLLQSLVMHDNMLSGGLPSSLGLLTALTALNISLNRFTGKVMEQPFLYNMTVLEQLVLSDNMISGSIPTEIANLGDTLTHLSLSYNNLSGTLPRELGMLSNVGTLDLRGNALSGSLEPFCSVQPVFDVDGGDVSADCLLDTVTCSCCTVCCEEEGSPCIEI